MHLQAGIRTHGAIDDILITLFSFITFFKCRLDNNGARQLKLYYDKRSRTARK